MIQVLSDPVDGHPVPVLAAVGPMQYDVALHRMAREFGAPVELSPLPYTVARLTDADGAAALRDVRNVEVLSRNDGTMLALFPNDFWLEQAQKQRPEALLEPLASAG